MNIGRCNRVVSGENVTGENCERERLVARAEEISPGQLVVFIKRVIDLGDETVDVIRSRRRNEEVRQATVLEEWQWSIRRRPRIASQQTSDDGILRTTKFRNLARIGNARS